MSKMLNYHQGCTHITSIIFMSSTVGMNYTTSKKLTLNSADDNDMCLKLARIYQYYLPRLGTFASPNILNKINNHGSAGLNKIQEIFN